MFKIKKRSIFINFLTSKKHLKRDFVVIFLLISAIGIFFNADKFSFKKISEKKEVPIAEDKIVEKEEEISEIQARIDTTNWIPYQNTWFGFWLKYPNGWVAPIAKKPVSGSDWEQKIEFRIKEVNEKNPFEGFDVVIYNVPRIKELSHTDEFPKLKVLEMKTQEECVTSENHIFETGDYPAEEIYVTENDSCYNTALFFTNTQGSYIYNIVPKLKDGEGLSGNPRQEITAHMPEFFSVVSNWRLIDIQRPKPVPPKPKITAPMPVSYKIVNGRRVCAKKNDHPGKSKQGKKKHLDMECCLDPDEYPNPNCYYPPEKYRKYL